MRRVLGIPLVLLQAHLRTTRKMVPVHHTRFYVTGKGFVFEGCLQVPFRNPARTIDTNCSSSHNFQASVSQSMDPSTSPAGSLPRPPEQLAHSLRFQAQRVCAALPLCQGPLPAARYQAYRRERDHRPVDLQPACALPPMVGVLNRFTSLF
jgi:hypothetical protein